MGEIPYIQTVEKTVEVPQAGETVNGGQRSVTMTLETVRQEAPAEFVQVTEMGPPLPAERGADVILAPPAPAMQVVQAPPVVMVAEPVMTTMAQPVMVAEPVMTTMAPPVMVAEPVMTTMAPAIAPTMMVAETVRPSMMMAAPAT